jgi:hypothetical protein
VAFGSQSRIFRAVITDLLKNQNTVGSALNLDLDVPKCALFNNSVTPDVDAASASTAYNTGTWLVANEVSHAGQWAAGGVALASAAVSNPSTGVVMYDAADTASGAAATLASVFGCLVYDDTLTGTVADQGLSFNSFGGAQSITAGTFTVVWNVTGVLRITT